MLAKSRASYQSDNLCTLSVARLLECSADQLGDGRRLIFSDDI